VRTATINPARYLNREYELGSITEGKLADLVILDANPLEDIHNVRRVHAAMMNGRFFDRLELLLSSP
jgi:imidazolonepropionase-like amidohydrolase